MKKIGYTIIEIIFLISMTLLGKFKVETNTFMLDKYQIVVSFFWFSFILFFKESDKLKTFVLDILKNFVVSLAIIPIWFWISGEIENEIYEPLTIIIHVLALLIVALITHKSVKMSGTIAYYTHAMIPIITIILIKVGTPVTSSVIIAVLILEVVNYLFYIKENHKK